MTTRHRFALSAALCIGLGTTAQATVIGGVDLPQGSLSFADSVGSFTPGPGAAAAFQDPTNALGPPDVNTTNGLACYTAPSTANCKFTSLGTGGSLVLRFTDNVLTGSSASGTKTGVGDGVNDLYFWEVGVAEATGIDISKDGVTWTNVGSIGGGGTGIGVYTYGFDIDKAGFGTSDTFTWVRINDLLTDPGTSPAGADIDAVAGIQTLVPLPAGAWLFGSALAGLVGLRGRKKA